MLWKKYTIRTTTADCELVCATLMDYGITDVQIDNYIQLTDEELNQMYADFVKELPEDDGSCSVSFYLDEKGFIPEGVGTGDSPSAANESEGYQGLYVNMQEVREGLQEAAELFGIRPVTIETAEVNTQDWDRKWKEYFKPFKVGNILIKPTWETIPADAENRIVLEIDPGMAFGTGIHETTRLCLTGLQHYFEPGDRVLDLGTGSGILGIAALKLGASHVTAIDIDEQAVRIAQENFEQNCSLLPGKTAGTYEVAVGNILQDTALQMKLAGEKYDVVLANILADVIVPLSGFVGQFLKTGGVFISSGIIQDKEPEVLEAIRRHPELSCLGSLADGDWRSVIAEKTER